MIGQPQVYEALERMGIAFDYYEHPEAPTIEIAAQFYRGEGTTLCKNLFFRNHKGNRHYLVVFECHKVLDIHSLEHKLRQGKLSFASSERMERCLGLLPGSVSPLGLINDIGLAETDDSGVVSAAEGVAAKELFPNGHRVKLFLDQDLREAERVSFHPCDNTASVVLSNADFMRFLELWGGEYEWLDF